MESDGAALDTPKRTPTSRFKLPKLDASISDSLTAGTSIPPPPPPPPPKDVPPTTDEDMNSSIPQPQSSFEYRPSTSTTVPGAFPSSPMDSPSDGPQTPSAPPRTENNPPLASGYPLPATPSTSSPRRPGSLSRFFRPLSRFYRNSSDSHYSSPPGHRPDSPGSSSIGSVARPSLSHKKSGSFWDRRKSSLGMNFEAMGQNGSLSPGMNGSHTVVEKEVEKSSPDLGEADVRPRLNKKKSGPFPGRRKSSLGMTLEEAEQDPFSRQQTNGTVSGLEAHLDTRNSGSSHQQQEEEGEEQEEEERTRSPPPTLPEVAEVYDGGSLGAEDMFKNIH